MWHLADKLIKSRLLLGTAGYPSLDQLIAAITLAKVDVITLALRRETSGGQYHDDFYTAIRQLNCHILPNTAGCYQAHTAIKTAEIARELFATNWIKLEVIGDDYTLQPDSVELLKAASELVVRGFEVFPYCTDDLVLCQKLVDVGCRILMPLAAPIGSGKGLISPYALALLRQRLPQTTLIIDAGIGKPSHAAQAMEMGYDAVLVNTACAAAKIPSKMASALQKAVQAGRQAFLAGIIPERNMAYPSTCLMNTPFWQAGEP